MTVAELRDALRALENEHGPSQVDGLEVILRATNHETDDVIVCGVRSIGIESGCTETPALMVDGDTEIPAPPEDDA